MVEQEKLRQPFQRLRGFWGDFAKRMAPKPPEAVNITENTHFKHFPKNKW